MRQQSRILATGFMLFLGAAAVHAQTFVSTLSAAAENPPTASTASGSTTVILDTGAHTLRVIANFSGLTTGTTASHIHCCVAVPPGNGNVGVATMTPSFVGFPLGVTSGSMDQTYNTLNAATWNAPFIAANGATPAGAEAALASGLRNGTAYLNLHTTMFPGGEIRGFLLAGPTGFLVPTLSQSVIGVLALLLLVAAGWVLVRRRRA